MGIVNGNALYQRMMEWKLDEFDFADPYVEDVIIGSTGSTREELIRNHEADLRKVLENLPKRSWWPMVRKHVCLWRVGNFVAMSLRAGHVAPLPKNC